MDTNPDLRFMNCQWRDKNMKIKELLVDLLEPFYYETFMPWFEDSGFILYGGGKGKKPKAAAPLAGVEFKPYSLTTSTGTTTGATTPDGGFGANVELDPTIAALGQAGYEGALGLQPDLLTAIKDRPDDFAFDYDPRAAAKEYYTEQAGLLEPQFAQQRQDLKNDLFGSGRMGLMLSGSSVGAGEGGMVSPDAFGLGRAQSQTLAGISADSRQRALAEQQGLFGIASGAYGMNQGAQQQYLQNLQGGSAGLMGQGAGISELEMNLINQGLSIEQARSGALSNSAMAGAQLAQATPQRQSGKGGFLSAAATLGSAAIMGPAAPSDIRLKENLQEIDTDANGVTWYTWSWNDLAKGLGLDKGKTTGVVAQEVMKLFPDVVSEGSDGYLQVDYELLGSK